MKGAVEGLKGVTKIGKAERPEGISVKRLEGSR